MVATTQSTPKQRQLIHQLCHYDADVKKLLVQQVSKFRTETSLELSEREADELIRHLQQDWAKFDKLKKQHCYILSLMHQLQWTSPCAMSKFGKKPDMPRLNQWLRSAKSPVKKPLNAMTKEETSKVIYAMEQMLVK
jgi:pyruvate dehydrogenase complex dehydrogenase (E1) component